jgi:hypothetical protein
MKDRYSNTGVRHAEQVKTSKNKVAELSTKAVRKNAQRTVHSFAVASTQKEAFTQEIVKAIVTGNIPFTFIENSHFLKACNVMGISLPSRKVLADTWIPRLAQEAEVATKEILSKEHFVDASSDGWRKKACEQGDALLNVMALTLSRADFYDAINCSDMRKDATAIKQFLLEAAAGIVGEPRRSKTDLLGGYLIIPKRTAWQCLMFR